MKIPGVGWLRAGGGGRTPYSVFFSNLNLRKIYASTDKMKILAPRIDKSLRSIHVNDCIKIIMLTMHKFKLLHVSVKIIFYLTVNTNISGIFFI